MKTLYGVDKENAQIDNNNGKSKIKNLQLGLLNENKKANALNDYNNPRKN